MFLDNKTIKNSFRKVKEDMINLRQSLVDWVAYLSDNQTEMNNKVKQLEKRIEVLERIIENQNKKKGKKEVELY